jgi:hypothetical protein
MHVLISYVRLCARKEIVIVCPCVSFARSDAPKLIVWESTVKMAKLQHPSQNLKHQLFKRSKDRISAATIAGIN